MSLNDGTTVQVHYRGTLDDGSEFDSSAGREPLQFTIGASQVIGGFEQAVSELAIGDKTEVRIPPEEAYGPRDQEAVQTIPVEAFPETPPVGQMIQLQSPDGRTFAATVLSASDEVVELDFNHPLAGEALTFEIELVSVSGGQ